MRHFILFVTVSLTLSLAANVFAINYSKPIAKGDSYADGKKKKTP